MIGALHNGLYHSCQSGRFIWLAVAASYEIAGQQVQVTDRCPDCSQRFVPHWCGTRQAYDLSPAVRSWVIPLIKAAVKASCPECGFLIDVTDTIANDPEAAAQERELASKVGGWALVACAAVLGGRWLFGDGNYRA